MLLGLLAFWLGMAAAAHAYPAGYDWRYQTISVLLYVDQNPHGYLWAWAGLEICALAGIAWTAGLRRIHRTTTLRAQTGARLLQLGFVCMSCAVLPDRLLPWQKGHELFAILAFVGICSGLVWLLFTLVRDREFVPGGGPSRPRSVPQTALPLLPLVPLLLAAATQAYLGLKRPDLPWVGPAWRALGISPLLSFGLWEWVSCAVLSLGLLVLQFLGRPTAAGR